MADIRYVCLSDLHLGEEDSLLTNLQVAGTEVDPTRANPVMRGLAACLRDLIARNEGPEKPALILNGDILELALTTDNQAIMCFERFIEEIMPPGRELFQEIIYIPGNHDHHLWELARETQYVNYLRDNEKLQDKEQFKKLLYSLADGLAREYDLPGWGDRTEAGLAKWLFSALVESAYAAERTKGERLLSAAAEKGLWAYMNGPLREQMMTELKGEMPAAVTFVFGHTHKPFQEDMNFQGYPDRVNVYNTGGWVVETVAPQPLHGGAAVLIDEDLNAAALRLYNEHAGPAGYAVSLEEARHLGEPANPLYIRLEALLDRTAGPWKDFPETVARAVRIRAQNLRARINGQKG